MDDLTIFSHPARVRALAAPQEEVRARLSERFPDFLGDLYLWRAEISNDQLDSHFTHMAESTLRNYAEDAQNGVAFLKGHDWRSLPIGYSLDAAYEDEGDKKRVVADFYTVAGLAETDDLIKRMRAGILRDVSVGFHGAEMRCDLCGKDFWSCPHIPGLRYEVKEGDTMRSKLATFTIENARLSEVSGVFDGSTPGAMILKAEQEASAGRLTPEQVRYVETTYRVTLPASKRAFAGADTRAQTPREDETMQEDEVKRVQAVLARAGVELSDDLTASIEALGQKLESAQKKATEMEPVAADGRQYRADLVAEALAEGVRAGGQEFDQPTYEAMLATAPIATIKRMRDDWKRIGDARLPSGRASSDSADESAPKAPRASLVPATAHRG